jgi:2-polyprenyl-6-methoxyphenol hydroxylase-like FAD-dependent oxidoreductase
VAIIGGGIGGVALTLVYTAGPFTIYERDSSFDQRNANTDLLQQASTKQLKVLEMHNLQQGVISTRHLFDGKLLNRMRNGCNQTINQNPKN